MRNQPGAVETIPAAGLAGIVKLIAAGTITPTIGKQVYALLEADPAADPAALVQQHGLASIGDSSELEGMVDAVIADNPQFAEQFRAGKEGVINALVGQVMKQTRGRADARQVQQLLRDRLSVATPPDRCRDGAVLGTGPRCGGRCRPHCALLDC